MLRCSAMSDSAQDALRLLIQERDRLTKAIEILQNDTPPRRRGRPPKSAQAAAPAAKAKKARKKRNSNMSAEARQAVSDRMRKYWAKRRREKAKAAK